MLYAFVSQGAFVHFFNTIQLSYLLCVIRCVKCFLIFYLFYTFFVYIFWLDYIIHIRLQESISKFLFKKLLWTKLKPIMWDSCKSKSSLVFFLYAGYITFSYQKLLVVSLIISENKMSKTLQNWRSILVRRIIVNCLILHLNYKIIYTTWFKIVVLWTAYFYLKLLSPNIIILKFYKEKQNIWAIWWILSVQNMYKIIFFIDFHKI